MRIIAISDTHGEHEHLKVPEGDVIVSCGNWSPGSGHLRDSTLFAEWMGKLPHRHKIVVPGSHEDGVDHDPLMAHAIFRDSGVHLIQGMPNKCTVEVEGLLFGGGPWANTAVSAPHPWAWAHRDDPEYLDVVKWNRIPHVDVLVTQMPPQGILDQTEGASIGCPILRKHVLERIRPRVHVFGRALDSRGEVTQDGTRFVNVSTRTRTHVREEDGLTLISHGLRRPTVIDLDLTPCRACSRFCSCR